MTDKKVIFWDFDGTLAYCPGLWRNALMEVLEIHEPRHCVDVELIRPLLRDGFYWHQPTETHCHITGADEWWAGLSPVFQRAYEAAGFNPKRARELAGLVRQQYITPSRFHLFDDALPSLKILQTRGWRHVILSNHVPELAEIVESLGLSPYILTCISSAVTGIEKPNPEAYRNALHTAGNPQTVWMVGDNPEADVLGAEAAGIRAILVRAPAVAGITRRADDLYGVIEILNREEGSH